ncbi:MAG: chromosome segregation protein SMC [Cytophagales bacterium]
MEITRLEAKGFKSFGDKIIINFDKGITGVVGPNGCGKSNIVDAIRWVLGEQKSRTLRSDKMENVIFNGTKKRKAMQMAEVSLTFNNTKNILPTEYSQVTITRRYYRSGDSEYLLNGVQCRLKDITNLFMDTGIGSDSYAIIELKMVDDILQNKDGARKNLFEEAAGISKFKVRKRQTLKKLEDTDKDLERVEDLLFEIEKNMKSLEKQARQAQKYQELKSDYKSKSIELAQISMSSHKQRLDKYKAQIQSEKDQRGDIQSKIQKQDSKIEEEKKNLISKEKELSSAQKSLNEHVEKIRNYESEKNIKNERLRYLNSNLERLNEQLDSDKKSNERAAFSIKSLEQELLEIAEEVKANTRKVEELQKLHHQQKEKTEAKQTVYDELLKSKTDAQQEYYQISKALEINEIQLESLKQQIERADTDSGAKEKDIEMFSEKIAILETAIKEKEKELSILKDDESKVVKQIEAAENDIEKIRNKHIEVRRSIDSKENEYKLTKSLVDNLEGFPEAIKFLKKSGNWAKKSPLLSDIISTDENHKLAIENYLEPYLNYYVVASLDEALKAIHLLSDASKGKANFFILSEFDNYLSQKPKIFNSAIPATELVEYDVQYKKLVQYLLDNVYIVEKIDDSILSDKEVVWISKDGKTVKRKFSLSGGSVGLFEGKRIGREKNLVKLKNEIQKLLIKDQETEAKLKKRQFDLEELKKADKNHLIDEKQDYLNNLKQELVSIKTRKEQFEDLIASSSGQKEDIRAKIEEIESSKLDQGPKLEKCRIALENIEKELKSAAEELEKEKINLTESAQAFNEANIFFIQLQNKEKSLTQDIDYKKGNFENSKERIEKAQSDIQKTNEEIKVLLSKTDAAESDLVELYDQKESLENTVNEKEKAYYALRTLIDDIEKQVREFQRKKEVIDSFIHSLEEKRNETDLAMTALKERLSVEFEIEIDIAKIDGNKSIDEEEKEALLNEVQKIKDRLERLGPINPMALEAYEEIKNRYDFIIEQKDDLIQAKESLLNTISEIDLVARETFEKAFELIRVNFHKVFRTLFTKEDSCDLKLLNPDDPVDSDIEIFAQPKGKRPLTINQLSGGEKTLTATSLLFAIYLLKPAPFCIFDEVDAPLDDANIDKFNNIVREFSNESQFIIVTHNKRTMASTDIIYGITMVENGVSRVVPVDLRELT